MLIRNKRLPAVKNRGDFQRCHISHDVLVTDFSYLNLIKRHIPLFSKYMIVFECKLLIIVVFLPHNPHWNQPLIVNVVYVTDNLIVFKMMNKSQNHKRVWSPPASLNMYSSIKYLPHATSADVHKQQSTVYCILYGTIICLQTMHLNFVLHHSAPRMRPRKQSDQFL